VIDRNFHHTWGRGSAGRGTAPTACWTWGSTLHHRNNWHPSGCVIKLCAMSQEAMERSAATTFSHDSCHMCTVCPPTPDSPMTKAKCLQLALFHPRQCLVTGGQPAMVASVTIAQECQPHNQLFLRFLPSPILLPSAPLYLPLSFLHSER
jgi:hypothetical protein